jgi:hypothetical protein
MSSMAEYCKGPVFVVFKVTYGLALLEEIHVHKPIHSLGNYKTRPHTELQSRVV